MSNNFEESEEGLKKLKKISNSKTPFLDEYGTDLTQKAKNGELDPIIGREEEMIKIVRILTKKKKNNPIILGDPGTGKTALAELLADLIIRKEVDKSLWNKRIVELNLTSIVSGTKYRGQFEEKMESIMKEIENNPDVIIFMDEFHNVIGAGNSQGSLDASNIIKPALARGKMRCIASTTLEEYKKVIEKDGALERRFQKVYVDEPSKEQTLEILKKISANYEKHHKVLYSEGILKECVNLADRYLTYRKFPDKAIDLMDEAGAKARMKSVVPNEITDLEQQIKTVTEKKHKATVSQKFEQAADLRDEEKKLRNMLQIKMIELEEKNTLNKTKVTFEDLATIISSHTGIPVNKINKDENKKLLEMPKYLKQRVIGQDHAVEKISEVIQRSRVGIYDKNKPTSFLMLGTTGVGKTFLAKCLSKFLFDDEDSLIRFDMSEYLEKHSISKLIGAPPGYVGFEEKGLLTEKVKNKPYSVILFDEVEKAHPDVFNILLQVLDEGYLVDSVGQRINFRNTIIIMTSNIGTSKILGERTMGFKSEDKINDLALEDTIMKEVKKFFRPELINRIDEIVIFNPLGQEDIIKMVKNELTSTIEMILERGYKINLEEKVYTFLSNVGYDKEFGARPLKRAIVKYIQTPISKFILERKPREGYLLSLKVNATEDQIIVE